jgi:ferredoxin
MNDHVVDGSRCVNCFNCINVCPDDAIRYTSRRKQLSIPMMQSLKDLKRVPETTLDSGKPATCEKSKHNDK